MCGIAGLVGSNDIELMARMLRTMQHRGPDDWGMLSLEPMGWLGPSILGHQRLSIIDLSAAGHQPMANEDGSVWVVFNGEIYNFRTVRAELEALGHRFRSATDTEIVIHAYEAWGPSCVHRFNGMFAFAIMDTVASVLLLVRDRLGIKPLYYTKAGGHFLFASEMKALLEDPNVERKIDLESLDQYMTLGYVPGSHTMFRNVYRLEPGTMLFYDGMVSSVREYWSIPEHRVQSWSEAEEVTQFHDLLVDAVRLQLVSDVPLGAFLSGGLDSSVVVAIMARELGVKGVKTFCVGFEGGETRHDERAHAATLARLLGTRHEDVVCSEADAVEGLPLLVWHLDEPVAEDVLPAYLSLCRAARRDVTVVLTGEGSDEFCYGYRFYCLEQVRRRWAYLPGPARRAILSVVGRYSQASGLRKRALEYCLKDDEIEAFLVWSSVVPPEEKRGLYGDAVERHMPREELRDRFQGLAACRSEKGVDLVAWLEQRQRLVDYILLRTDRLSMAVGLEARVPFLDHRVVEFLSRVPVGAKIRGFTGKMILRRAFREALPRENIWRRKKPFAAPVARWLERATRSYLLDSRLVADGILTGRAIEAMLRSKGEDPRRYENQVWAVVMLEVWYRVFIRREVKTGNLLESTSGVAAGERAQVITASLGNGRTTRSMLSLVNRR